MCWVVMCFFISYSEANTNDSDSPDIGSEENGILEYSEDNPYAAKNERKSGEDLELSEESLSYGTRSISDMEYMNLKLAGTEKHQMPEIKLSRFEWVTTSQKGYGLAAGITLLAGGSFVILNIRRSIR